MDLTVFSFQSALYAASACTFNYGLTKVLTLESPINSSYGGHFQFLTIIGLTASYITVTFGFLGLIVGSKTCLSIKNKIQQLTLPCEVLISLLYGGIYAYDRELLIPKAVNVFLPLHVDFALHGAPALFLLTDFFLYADKWPKQSLPTLILYSILGVAYWFWVHKAYSVNGYFPYPLFSVVDTKGRAMIFVVSILIMFGIYLTLRSMKAAVSFDKKIVENDSASKKVE
ncbi:FAR-17a/AIG1-like protein [Lipomyces oligophaga]|uniref:FAR-17a/AIG1-like protein n=1 Tax=Lipomyces oligophaga TaxID=45792 RepID=UPI0034CF409F